MRETWTCCVRESQEEATVKGQNVTGDFTEDHMELENLLRRRCTNIDDAADEQVTADEQEFLDTNTHMEKEGMGEVTEDLVLERDGRCRLTRQMAQMILLYQILKELPIETTYEVTIWFNAYSEDTERHRVLGGLCNWCSWLDALAEKGTRGYRAIAVMSVMAKWYSSVVVQM